MKKMIFGALLALSVSAAAVSTHAATYLLTFARTGQGGYAPTGDTAASLYLNVANTMNGVGGYDVLGITSGTVDADAVTGLSPDPNPAHPNANYSTDGWFIFDNNLFLTAPHVSNPGLLFVSTTKEYNLFSNSPSQYELIRATPGVGYTGDSLGTVSITAVPEPAAWALMLTGFLGLGAALRDRRRRVAAFA